MRRLLGLVILTLLVVAGIAPIKGSKPRSGLHLENPGVFLDGGTRAAELVDEQGRRLPFCIDGRMCTDTSVMISLCRMPDHIFVGAHHPEVAGARSLPLWGQEERALVQKLRLAIENPVLITDPRWSPRDPVMARQIEAVEEAVRERAFTLDAMDSGRIESIYAVRKLFEVRLPIQLGVARCDPMSWVLEVWSSSSHRDTILIPYDHRQRLGSQVLVHGHLLSFGNGTDEDRLTIAYAQEAVLHPTSTWRQDRALRAGLARDLSARVSQILADDRNR